MKLIPVSGFNKVEGNLFYVEDEKSQKGYVLDMGIDVEMALFHKDKPLNLMTREEAIRREIVPDDSIVPKEKVAKILIGHAHYDHIGAVPLLERQYNAPILGTHFTIEVLKKLFRDRNERSKNKLVKVRENSSFEEVEFVKVNHSIPQATSIVLNTKEGRVVYLQDFKFDKFSKFGRINVKRFKELGQEGVKVMIIESLYVDHYGYCPSERTAKLMLENVIEQEKDSFLILTTYSSHIERIEAMVEALRKAGKEPIILGRSMEKYVKTANDKGITRINAPIFYTPNKVREVLKDIDRSKHALIVTGNQGEPGSLLDRFANDFYEHFKIEKNDVIIFSNTIIPAEVNRSLRALLEQKLRKKGARIIKDVHVSGHAYREEVRKMINLLNPEYIVPGHQDYQRRSALAMLAEEEGYEIGKNVLLLNEKEVKKL